MEASIASFAYLVAAVCFILGIRGLASPETARRGNWIAIAGMAIAVGATLLRPQIVTFELVLGGIVIGGAIGTVIALRVKITDLPQLVAIFNSLVGLAAVLIAAAALESPSLYGIPLDGGSRRTAWWRSWPRPPSGPSPSPARSLPSPSCTG